MERVKGNSEIEEKGVVGLAQVVKLSDTQVRIDFESGQSFGLTVTEDTLPEYFPFKKMIVNAKVHSSVTMNKAGTKVIFINPASGQLTVKFNKFPAAEGTEPAPQTFPGKKGKPYKAFGALFEVQKGNWKGANLYLRLYPNFGKDVDGNLAVAGSGSGSDTLYDFMVATGVANHVVEYSENPLPAIQKIAQDEGRTFDIIVAKGWVDTIIAPTNNEEAFASDEGGKDEVHPALQ